MQAQFGQQLVVAEGLKVMVAATMVKLLVGLLVDERTVVLCGLAVARAISLKKAMKCDRLHSA